MKKAISALVIGGSLAFLSACNAGVAAQIGDTKISQSTVQDRIVQINSERQKYDTSQMQLSHGEELNRTEMRFLLIANIFEKLAKQNGIVITKAMEDARKVEIYNQVGGIEKLPAALVNAQMAPADFDLYITSVLISDTLTAKLKAAGVADADTSAAIQQMVKNLAAKEPIKVNPQYGSWDYTNADLVAIDSAGTAVKIPTA